MSAALESPSAATRRRSAAEKIGDFTALLSVWREVATASAERPRTATAGELERELAEQQARVVSLAECLNELESRFQAQGRELNRALKERREAEDRATAIAASTSWRMTAPLRALLDRLRGRVDRGGAKS